LSRIATVIRLLGVLAIGMCAVILAGAAYAGRHAREREAMLLKVLGASRNDLRAILVAEYLSLAVFATIAGWFLTQVLTRIALPTLFETPAVFPYVLLFTVAFGTVPFNVTIGPLVGRRVSRTPPLEILR
jgi:putative ABC transport system permease protein